MSKSAQKAITEINSLLQSFPDPSSVESTFPKFISTLIKYKDLINNESELNSLDTKFRKYLLKSIEDIFTKCLDSLKYGDNFDFRIEAGNYFLDILNVLIFQINSDHDIVSVFNQFEYLESFLRDLICYNINNQDCFINGSEFDDYNTLGLVLIIFDLYSKKNKEKFDEFISESSDKIFSIFASFSFDFNKFQESIKTQTSNQPTYI